MQYEHIKKYYMDHVALVKHNFIDIIEVGPGTASVKIAERDEIKNHIGSQHAAALFGLGETASGAAMAGMLADKLMAARPVAASATIAYKKVAHGEIIATGAVNRPVGELREELASVGKVVFDVDVEMKDAAGDVVATMGVSWHVRMLDKK